MTDNATLDGSLEGAAQVSGGSPRRSLLARIPSRRAAFLLLALFLGVLLVGTIEVLFYVYARSQLVVTNVPNLVAFLVISGVAVVAVECIVVWFSANLINRPFAELLTFTRGVQSLDLVNRCEVDQADEVGQTASALNTILDQLQAAIAEVAGGASRLGHASLDLESVSSRMTVDASATSERATVASSAAEQISLSAQTAATGLEQLADSVQEVARTAASAAISADAGVRSADRTGNIVEKLGASSAEISGIIAVITDIAEQTNLLALNATIEAARAGDAGRGFAVVANEVKDLARETAKATERVSLQVAAIQTDSARAAEAIGEISDVIRDMSDFQTTIAAAVEQQAVTTAEIGRSVMHTASGGRDIASSVALVAASAESAQGSATEAGVTAAAMLTLSEELQHLVDRFRYTA